MDNHGIIKGIHYKRGAIKRSLGVREHGQVQPGTLIRLNQQKTYGIRNKPTSGIKSSIPGKSGTSK